MPTSLPNYLQQQAYLYKLAKARRRTEIILANYVPWRQIARPKQLAPDGDWQIWCILAGRGFGKSRSVNEWAIEKAYLNPGSRGALVATTASDVRDVVVEGESGILAISPPDFRPEYYPSKRRLVWPNGTIAMTFSADEPRRLRGPQHHWAICDELAAWRRPSAFDMLLFGLRLGQNPQVAVSTTPRPTPIIKSLVKDPTAIVVSGTTYENITNLAPPYISKIVRRYEGTTLGRQELNAEILSDIPGALWKRANIDNLRVDRAPSLVRIVVSIDPAASSTEESNYTGIIVSGIAENGHGFLLDDVSAQASPAGWATAAIDAYVKWGADRIVAETNNGGEMVEHTVRVTAQALHDKDPSKYPAHVAYRGVHASRGKVTRAEPIAALYEQGLVHHCGSFPELEDQQCTWVPGEDSPDRMDAAVWGLTDLMLGEDETMYIDEAPMDINDVFSGEWRDDIYG